jgi:hypothetical protein
MAEYLRVDLKGQRGEVDLAFKGIPFSKFESVARPLCGERFFLVENGKSSALRIAGLGSFSVTDGTDVIGDRVKIAYEAAKTLLLFWQENRAAFDALAAVN